MANIANPGFTPARLFGVGNGTITYARKRAISNNTNPIGLGDAVKTDSNHDCLGLGTSSTHATAVETVAMGVSYLDANSVRIGAKNLPASTTYTGSTVDPLNSTYIMVVENPANVLFECSVDTAIALTDLNLNYSINLASPSNGFSGQSLNVSAKATTATLPFRAIEFVFRVDNDVDSSNAHILAAINAGQVEPALNTTGT